MPYRTGTAVAFFAAGTLFSALILAAQSGQPAGPTDKTARPRDPAAEATGAKDVPKARPEQKLTEHDRSPVFDPTKPAPLTKALKDQPKEGRVLGFDFARDPLNGDRPFQPFAEIMKKESEQKPKVMAAQRKLLEGRYDLTPRFDPQVKMARGKPVCVGPTARLAEGMTWDKLGSMSPADVKKANAFPYPSLPHPLHTNGGQVFPPMQIAMFPRLQRFDVDFDIPEAFLPEFPPAIFLQNRPELGDVSRGQVVHLGNFRDLFKEIMTPVQLEGMRLLLTPFFS